MLTVQHSSDTYLDCGVISLLPCSGAEPAQTQRKTDPGSMPESLPTRVCNRRMSLQLFE